MAKPEAAIISLVTVLLCILRASCQARDTTISFYGGYHHETVPAGERGSSFSVAFDMRGAGESGIVLLVELQRPMDYVAVAIDSNRQLQVLLSLGGGVSAIGSTHLSGDPDWSWWQRVEVEVDAMSLTVKLQDSVVTTYTFLVPLQVHQVYFGGPRSFFLPQYAAIPVQSYYVGCMANLTLNSVLLEPVLVGHGVGYGCCIAPRDQLWCLHSTDANLTALLPSLNYTSDVFSLSFALQLRSDEDGVILLSHSSPSPWSFHLLQSRLHVEVNVPGEVWSVQCPGLVTDVDDWHHVHVQISSSAVTCNLDGNMDTAVPTQPVPVHHFYPETLQMGGASSSLGQGFVGCLQRLRVDGREVDPGLLLESEADRAVEPFVIPWSKFSFNTSDLVVRDRMQARLTTDNVIVEFPRDQFADPFTAFYQREVENAIHFEALYGPHIGDLFIGQHYMKVEEFDYRHLVSEDPVEQVGYFHHGQGNVTDDVIWLRVWAGCGDRELRELEPRLFLVVSVEQQELVVPIVQQSQQLRLAVGTRRAITPEILTVWHPVVTDPAQFSFSVRHVAVQDSGCGQCEGGVMVNDASRILFFSQEDVNRGIVAFQHFARFSTSPVDIELEVTVDGVTIDVTLPVSLYNGSIQLEEGEGCLFVKEGATALLHPELLNATTNFQDQQPVISYDILSTPPYGILQRYDTPLSEWLDLQNSSASPSPVFGGGTSLSSFTQADINNGRVRYVQSQPIGYQGVVLEFRLRSSNLSGETGSLCINIVHNDFLVETVLNVEHSPLPVLEGGSAAVNHSVLNTSLDDVLKHLTLDVQDFEVEYTLVEPPSFGDLELRGEILVAEDVFRYTDITSNSLVYRHRGTEDHHDSFSFYVESDIDSHRSPISLPPLRAPNRTSNLTLVITVTAINNHIPRIHTLETILVPEGLWTDVTTANINITDQDRPDQDIKIYLRKRGDTPTGFFALRDSSTQPVTHFFMRNVSENKIIFVHRLNASAPLNYTQTLRIDDGEHTLREPVVVAAIPLSLHVSIPNRQCLATLDAAQPSPALRFDPSHFTASLLDHYGNNANLVPNITVHVRSPPSHGQILLINDHQPDNVTLMPVSQFKYRDLWRVEYVLGEGGRNASEDQVVLEFGYGHSEVVVHTLTLCILPILLPLSFQTSLLTLTQGEGGADGLGHLTTRNLMVIASRESDIGLLYFEQVRPPFHGHFLNQHEDIPVTRFSHSDLSDGSIVYVHHSGSNAYQDFPTFNVCSEYQCLGVRVLEVRIYPVNLQVQNTTIHIREGGLHRFNLTDLKIQAPIDHRVFVTVGEPNHGEIIRRSAVSSLPVPGFYLDDVEKGLIYYNNTDLEQLHDCFDVRVEATPSDPSRQPLVMEFLMRIEIEPVNNHAPEIVRRHEKLLVVRGSSAVISSSLLRAHDSDVGTEDDHLLWVNNIPTYFPMLGYIFIANGSGGAGGREVTSWTEGDIRNNRLYYQHDSDESSTSDHLFTRVTDGEKNDTYLLRIEIVAVAIEECSVRSEFNIQEGASQRITYQDLRFCADNDNTLDDSNFEISILDPPDHGSLTLNGARLGRGASFTQTQIHSGQLLYNHDNSNTERDSFQFNVSVPIRQNSFIVGSFDIKIAPIDDDPPVVIIKDFLYVVQDSRVEITNRTFSIIDQDSITDPEIDKVECRIVQGLSQGQLGRERFGRTSEHILSFTKYDLDYGMLWYRHLQKQTLVETEQLIFNVTDGVNHQPEIYNVTIIVLPKELGLDVGRLGVTEDEMVHLTAEDIVVRHRYVRQIGGNITVVTPPQHGQLFYVGSSQRQEYAPITNFTTEELANGSIAYYHSGDESSLDAFQFIYLSRAPADRYSAVHTLYIDITPVDDNPPMLAHNTTHLKMWANDRIVLEEKYLNITDLDTAPNKLIITVGIMGLGGHLAFANASSVSIHSFTQADLRAGRVQFAHMDGRKGELLYNVTDGVQTASGMIHIFADPLELECDTTEWDPIQVQFLGSRVLSPANLHCTTSSEVTSREFYFNTTDNILGHFELNSRHVHSFNSSALAAGLVTYVHTETALWKEGETLSVSVYSHPAMPKFGLGLNVSVNYPEPPAGSHLAVNTGLRVQEGGNHTITLAVLDARNLRYQAWLGLESREVAPSDLLLEYRLLRPPENGSLTLNGSVVEVFTQADLERDSTTLLYTHDDSESLTDALLMDIAVLTLNGTLVAKFPGENVSVMVTPVNDEPPLLLTNTLEKTLVQHHQTFLTSDDLEIRDADSSPEQVMLMLTSLPNNTDLSLSNTPLTVNSSFPQSALDRELVGLQPHAVGTSTFSFTFSDGALSSEQVLNFTLVVEQHTLSLLTLQEVTYIQNQWGTAITPKHINTSTNGLRSQTHFRVAQAPHFGRLMIGESEVQDFTQLDVDASRVKYIPHMGSQQHRDNFSLNVTNRELSQRIEGSVRVLAWGRTNYSSSLDFSRGPDQLSLPLPPDVLILDQQVSDMGYLPTIQLLQRPRYGHLEMRIPSVHPDIALSKRFTSEIESFTSNDLQQGWIVYVWDHPHPVYNASVLETFPVLVEFDGMQPGEAIIEMTVYPPSPPASTEPPSTLPPLTTSAETGSPGPTAANQGSGFSIYILVPIIGVIVFLLILIALVVIFCFTQQKKMKKKWAPSLSPPPHQSPWSTASPPIPIHSTHYDYDPSALPISDPHQDINNSDTSSGFSEPDISPRHTPVRTMFTSPHPHSPTFQPPRSRMRRNVSITFSSHHSTASELSLEPPTSSLSQYASHPGPSSAPITLPARPASHTAFNRPHPPIHIDSGVVSLQSHPGNYSLSRELSHTPSDDPQPPESCTKAAEHAEWSAGEGVPDFSDPNVQRLFHAQNPVLKKEEYWV